MDLKYHDSSQNLTSLPFFEEGKEGEKELQAEMFAAMAVRIDDHHRML